MMIQKIKLYLIITASTLLTTSCLDKFPENAVLAENAITSVNDADQAILGVYAAMKSSSLFSGHLTLMPDTQSDLVYAIDGYTNKYGDTWRWEILSTNTDIKSVYGALYMLIGRCNFLLEGIADIESGIANDDDYQKLQQYKGEAHFARALAYSELVKMFCKDYDIATANENLGVVLVASYWNATEMKRATLQESYNFILKDLDLARAYLDDNDDANNVYYNQPYFTKYTVEALYSRVYLYMDNAEKAIEHSSNVIESGKFALANVNEYNYYGSSSINNYQYMWLYDSSEEVIFKVGFQGPNSFGGALGTIFLNYSAATGYKPDYVPAQWALDEFSSTDLRKSAIFSTLTTSHTHKMSWPLLIKYYGNQSFISAYNRYHMSMPKIFRLSEQYLIRAEAYAMSGKYSAAAEDITTLRKARYSSYGSTSITASNWLDVINVERMKELYMEGFRLNDLKRWKKGFTRKAQSNSVNPGDNIIIEADNPLFVWPIPQHELDIPGANIEPNESNN